MINSITALPEPTWPRADCGHEARHSIRTFTASGSKTICCHCWRSGFNASHGATGVVLPFIKPTGID